MRCRISNSMVAVIATSLLFCIIMGANQANGQDFFMGKVLSVDAAKKEIKVVPDLPPADKSVSGAKEKSILVRSKVTLPSCVTAGANIRLWGERLPGDIHTFIASEIRGCRGGGCSDPTGVRTRLSRRGKHSWSALSHPDHIDQSTEPNGKGSGRSQGKKGRSANGKGGGK